MPADERSNVDLSGMATRIRATLEGQGWAGSRCAREVRFVQNAIRRMLAGGAIRASTLQRIGRALGAWAEGDAKLDHPLDHAFHPVLKEVPGYATAELQVARLEPSIAIEVFEAARQTRFAHMPATISVAFLHAHVLFLVEHGLYVANSSDGPPSEPSHS